jgi:uncharacterized protein YfcZ (UPF0381/DUF406 family)
MTEVYIIFRDAPYQCTTIHSIWSSKEKAEIILDELKYKARQSEEHYSKKTYIINDI